MVIICILSCKPKGRWSLFNCSVIYELLIFVGGFSVCDVKTPLCKYGKKKNVFHVHGYYHIHYAGLTCTIIKVSEIFYANMAACCS